MIYFQSFAVILIFLIMKSCTPLLRSECVIGTPLPLSPLFNLFCLKVVLKTYYKKSFYGLIQSPLIN